MWSVDDHTFRYAQELNALSMFHLRVMIRQMLITEQIPNLDEWEETLFRLSLQIARALSLDSSPLITKRKSLPLLLRPL